jgi:hypothetical protein
VRSNSPVVLSGVKYIIPYLCGVDRMKTPRVLDAVADVVLVYRPQPKTKPARRRKRRAAKIQREK